jgi:hypothetical protein
MKISGNAKKRTAHKRGELEQIHGQIIAMSIVLEQLCEAVWTEERRRAVCSGGSAALSGRMSRPVRNHSTRQMLEYVLPRTP